MSFRGKILYGLFVGLFTIVVVELAATYYLSEILNKSTDKKFRFSSYLIYEHVPNFREGDGEKDWIILNSQGFRREEDVSKDKPEDVFRAFLLGGSAAHGISSAAPYPIEHVYMDETIDAHLERMLEVEFPDKKMEIINVAVTGYKVFQHTQYLLSELLDYDPDLVIFMDGVNDHYRHNPKLNYYKDNKYQFWKSRLQEPSLGGMFDYLANFMADYSALFRAYVSWNLQRDAIKRDRAPERQYLVDSDQDMIVGYDKVSPREYLRSIQANLDLLSRHGIEAIVSLQPSLNQRDKALLSEAELSFRREVKIDPLHVLYPHVLRDLQQLTRENNVDFVNLVPVFNLEDYAGTQLFIDYCHLNSAGGEVIAQSLLPYAKPHLSRFFMPALLETAVPPNVNE